MVPGEKLDRDDRSSASTIAWLEQRSTTKGTGARHENAYRSNARRFLEQCSTGVIGAVLDDRLVGARFPNQGHWSKAQQCLPEQGSTVPGAVLNRRDRSSAQRFLGWSKASTTKDTGARHYSACRRRVRRPLEQGFNRDDWPTTEDTGA